MGQPAAPGGAGSAAYAIEQFVSALAVCVAFTPVAP
jgi:hypothetical protein